MLDFTELLPLLDHSTHRSGQELATHFDITRATIHNCILRIESQGIAVERVPGLGYRLCAPLDLLDKDAIVNNLAPKVASKLQTLQCLQQVDSTNQTAAGLTNPRCWKVFGGVSRNAVRRQRSTWTWMGVTICSQYLLVYYLAIAAIVA